MSRNIGLLPSGTHSRWGTLIRTWCTLASFLTAVACEEGTSGGGAAVVQGTGGGNLADGGSVAADGQAEVSIVGADGSAATGGDGSSATAQDAEPTDGAVGGDVGLQPVDAAPVDPALSCVGKCGQAQPNKWKCQCDPKCATYKDCCADFEQVCKSDPGPGPGPDPVQILGCLQKSCPSNVAKCTADPLCAQFWECAKACKDSNCLQLCGNKFDLKELEPVLQPLLDCGQKAACFEGGSTVTPPSGPVCGDGKCEQPENSLNCQKDCPNTPPGDAQKCLNDKCKDQYTTCFKSQSCVSAVACINTGKPQQQCVSDDKTAQQLNAMLQCGYQNGCLNGGQPTAECGNAKCEPGETSQNCPKDCDAPPPPTDALTKCVAEKCAAGYANCAVNESCLKALTCIGKGGSLQTCAAGLGSTSGQLIAVLGQCAYQNGCLSNTTPGGDSCKGKCGQFTAGAKCQCNQVCKQLGNCCGDFDTQCGSTSTGSCQGKCGQFTPGAQCQCNTECSTFKNCCGDFEKLCGNAPPTGVCGDGVCTAPAETTTSCPKDCSQTPPPAGKPCKTKGDCADAEICCGLANGSQVCALAGQCK